MSQTLNRRDTITDHPGQVIDHEPDYLCPVCSNRHRNYPLPAVVAEYLSKDGNRHYGHVSCPAVIAMRERA